MQTINQLQPDFHLHVSSAAVYIKFFIKLSSSLKLAVHWYWKSSMEVEELTYGAKVQGSSTLSPMKETIIGGGRMRMLLLWTGIWKRETDELKYKFIFFLQNVYPTLGSDHHRKAMRISASGIFCEPSLLICIRSTILNLHCCCYLCSPLPWCEFACEPLSSI